MQLYQKVQGQGAAAPPGTQKLAERDVVAVKLPSNSQLGVCMSECHAHIQEQDCNSAWT